MICEDEKTPGKREARRQERREAIVAVAQRHFREHGYSGTSMSAIAADLGGSKTTLWTYFASKEDLFAAALDEWTVAFGCDSTIHPAGDLRETLTAYCTEFLRVMLTPEVGTLFRLVIAEASRSPEIGRIFYERAPLRRHKAMAAYFETQIAAGTLRPVDTLRAAAQLHHLCMYRIFMHSMWGLGPDVSDQAIAREVEEAVTLFLDGYAATSG
ncbi:MAG: TetR/AcrR family transcriptional regulator [Candidatus Andeanibacterium colombiense]|uniref:TetR/AcrR family transcriptional regulator n=1 Tax=Candidatus Andeanibacterium colombiense TaxID=3121345 RepID=A0AAJ5X5P9_9SPHN|nr:MAG: TetR/AcrR family transcriptional regulator [Sphingomonadaceae bacterium]